NQTSINTHDSDETINIGLGYRELFNNDEILIGSNIFYDYQFNEKHKRFGTGIEAISSVFDIRGNYYNALSGTKKTDDGGSERALDGWDAQLDYHFPIMGDHDLNIFANLFKFENPAEGSTYEEKGNKIGANTMVGNWAVEAGYLNDNQDNDSYFGSIKYVVNLGGETKKDYYALSEIKDPTSDKKIKDSYRSASLKNKRTALERTSVKDKLYLPVKRENKIRVVKISSSGFVASGF
ncbi:inverse autotransporter beta domain-containing protein, partial [Candidatus Pelagibacter sp.]|nr:inverse autotransporter beta domain-containing protein [Candidatus Pelagibacter sp.]